MPLVRSVGVLFLCGLWWFPVAGLLAQETAGGITVADAPFCILVPELMEIYPDAVVVCPMREREIWA